MPTLQQALDTFLKLPRAPATNKNYGHCLGAMVRAIGPARDVRLVSHADLVLYIHDLQRRVSASSLNQYTVIIKAFFVWLVQSDELIRSPAGGLVAPKPSPDPSLSRAMPTEFLLRMHDLARSNPRDYAILLFLVDTACRRGAVARLTCSRLNLDQGIATVLEKGSIYCEVYFGEETAQALRAWLVVRPKVEHDYVFTRNGLATPLKPESVSAAVRRLAQRVGQTYGPHAIRHFVAEHWAESGEMPNTVQHKLNHKHLASTLIYFPNHNRYVQEATRRLSITRLRKASSSSSLPPFIIPLDPAN